MDKEWLLAWLKELITELKEGKITPKHLAREILSDENFFQIYFDYVMYNDDISLEEYEQYHRAVFHYLNCYIVSRKGK